MRIKEEFKTAGYFWLPSAPDKRIPGTLVITDGGNIELEVVGHFDASIEGLNKFINNEVNLERIIGHIEKYGYVTLDNCFYTNKNLSFGGISKSSIHVSRAFVGIAYEEKEVALFNNFRFSVEGIDEWIGLSGIKVKQQLEEQTASITYTPPKEISLNINNGMKLLITFSWSIRLLTQKEAKITQKIYFKLTSEQECPINDFISAAYKVTTLLCFAMDETVCIKEVSSSSDSTCEGIENSRNMSVNISLYYKSSPYTKNEPIIDLHRMLFQFGQIKEDAERIVNNWFDTYEEIHPALNLYFSVKTDSHKYLENKFLALIQGLETYHRRTCNDKLMDEEVFQKLTEQIIEHCPEESKDWLSGRLKHGNEISLNQRIKSIITPFKKILGSNREREKIIRAIVNTRNYLTHYDQSLESKAATGQDLWILCRKMEAIFQLHLLQRLSFNKSEIRSVYENSDELKKKLREG